MLCETPEPGGYPCTRCPACHWFGLGNHPDFRLISPESDEPGEGEPRAGTAARASKTIRIDQVRALQDWLSVGAHQSGWRVAVVVPAEAMTHATANALLKTLEEPPPGSLIILSTHRPARLLPTLRSRCQTIMFPVPERALALAWLARAQVAQPELMLSLTSGAPLKAREASGVAAAAAAVARELAGDAVQVTEGAARLAAYPPAIVIDLMQKWMYDSYCARRALPIRYYRGLPESNWRRALSWNETAASAFDRRLLEARRLADHPLNPRLVLEDLLSAYAEWLG